VSSGDLRFNDADHRSDEDKALRGGNFARLLNVCNWASCRAGFPLRWYFGKAGQIDWSG